MYLKYIPEKEKRTPIYNCFLEMAHSPGPSLPLQYWHWWDTVVIGYVRYWMLQFRTGELSRRKGWGLWNFKIWNEKGLLYECRKDQKLNENFYMSCPVLFFIFETYEPICVSTVIMKAFTLQSLYVVTSQKMSIFASNLKHPNESLGGI